MKKFTFIATLLLAFASMANAELMDKYFFKIATDKNPGWTIQDGTNTVMSYDKAALTVQQKKNAGRMLNYFFNDAAWQKDILASHPTYKFTMDMKMTSMAARGDMEFTLLPVDACTSSDSRVSTHNYHWWNSTETEDFFFRWRVVTAPTEANGDFTIIINETPAARNEWETADSVGKYDKTCVLSSQKLYKFVVAINTEANTATYTITDADGTEVATGVHSYVCGDKAGIFVYSTNGTSTAELSNMGLCYEAEGPFANEPSADLLACRGAERDYYAQFSEGETLHWIQLGAATDALGNEYADGEEYTASYYEANDTRDFEQDTESTFGSKVIYCAKSGTLKMWTTRSDDDSNVSDETNVEVTCEAITLPQPVATITNVSEGYGKTYTFSADNSDVLCTPTITIRVTLPDGTTQDFASGESYTFTGAGSLTAYSCDATHPSEWYTASEPITVVNNTEYVQYSKTDYTWSKDVCDGDVANFTKLEIQDSSNKSHWDRIYSDQHYGYDSDGNASAYVEGTEYASEKQGFGFYAGTVIGTEDCKWNVQVPNDIYTGLSPMVPSETSGYTDNAWNIFPLEGIVYYATSGNVVANPAGTAGYVKMELESKYTSDDANKPNFYIVHTRGGYDRPDKGDCNATTVCVAGENFWLYRYDTAICDVTVMTYAGFDPTTAISTVNASETAAPAVKKVATKNGIVIVKGNKAYSVAGALVK